MELKKISTIEKRHKLNDVLRLQEAGRDGCYRYAVHDLETGERYLDVWFQKGVRGQKLTVDGVTDQDLLEIVRDRLQTFQEGPLRSRETACAITHIEEALMWLYKRKEDRFERGVLNTYKE